MRAFETLGKWGQFRRLMQLAVVALGEYEVEVAEIKPLWHMDNTTFRVDGVDGKRYVLRIQAPVSSVGGVEPSEMQLRSEVEWLDAIRRDTDLVVPVPVKTHDGELMTIVEAGGVSAERMCVLFEWVYGRFLNKGLRAVHLEKVGVFTAKLHEHASKQFVVPKDFVRPRTANLDAEEVETIKANFAAVSGKKDQEVVRQVIERLQGVMRELGEGPDVFGLIHGDLHQWNYLFDGGEVRAIDFDDCGMAHFLYDIAVTVSKLKDREDHDGLQAAYLRGYRSVRELSDDKVGYLGDFYMLRSLKGINWIIEQREHPSFVGWEKDVEVVMGEMREYIAENS